MNTNYTNFLMDNMHGVYFVAIEHKGSDWRNDAVNEVLAKIKTDEPICFMEQDFLIKDESFFEKVFSKDHRFIYFTEGDRIHPAFAVVDRALIEQSSKDFSAYPSTYGDHFAKFFSELTTGINIEELGVKRDKDYHHLNGLSQNYHNFKLKQPFYRSEEFLYYNNACRYLPIENHPEFFQLELSIDREFGHPGTSFLSKFFPI